MDDKRDPLLGLPMRHLDIGSFHEDDEDYEARGTDAESDVLSHKEEVEDEDDGVADKLFPSDFTEEYTQIDPGQSFGAQPSTTLFPDDDDIEVEGSPNASSQTQTSTTTASASSSPPQEAHNGHPQPSLKAVTTTAVSQSQQAKALTDEEDDLLPGETLQLRVTDAVFLPDRLCGTLLVTSYRLEFTPNNSRETWRLPSYFKFPVTSISKIIRKPTQPSDELTIVCKDGRHNLQFRFSSDHVTKRAHSLLMTLAFPISQGVGFRWFFCFAQPIKTNSKVLADLLTPQHPFDEFGETRFRETIVNWDYCMSASYPKTFFVPKVIPDQQLKQIATFRSKGRIPALCWVDKRNPNRGGTMWRCSQPKVGFGASVSLDDEAFVEAIRRGTASGQIVVIDCRSAMAAMANKARGMGTEDVTRYRGTKLQFENIANYHTMRSSYFNLCRLMNKQIHRDAAAEETFAADVEATGWLGHTRAILTTSIKLAEAIGVHGFGAIVHCSDGWDRTPQVTALAQVLLDPECRTRKGFIRMIHREWILFGHKFRERFGVGVDAEESEERAPIFIQFLDCVWQMKRLFPRYFEFNDQFLECIAHHSYSSRFIEFMGNTAQDWENALQSDSGGCSLWETLLSDPRNEATFNDVAVAAQGMRDGMLLPRITVVCRQVALWDIFLKRCAIPSHPDHALVHQHNTSSTKDSSSTASWEWWM